MKRLLIIVGILLLITACGKVDDTTPANTSSGETTAPPSGSATEPVTTKGDLKAKIYPQTLYPVPGEQINIKIAAQNYGVQRITQPFDYKVVLTRNGEVIYEKSGIQPASLMLPMDEVVVHEFSYKFSNAGEHEVNLILDTQGKVTELDEVNNNRSVTIYVKEKDPDAPKKTEEDEQESGLEGEDVDAVVDSDGCYDSDSGKDYETVGTCTDKGSFTEGRDDFCATEEKIAEMYCSFGSCKIEVKQCGSSVCRDGKCL